MTTGEGPGTRFAVLDGLRGAAMIAVLLDHFGFPGVAPGFGLLERAFHTATRFGWVGVDVFFVLSGFLITGILLDTKERPGWYRVFLVRRALRIVPVYFVALAVFHFVLPALWSASPAEVALYRSDEPWMLAWLTNVRMSLEGRNVPFGCGHFWSLAVEEQFYLAWPLAVALLSRDRLRQLCLVLVLVAIGFRTTTFLAGAGHLPGYTMLFGRLDSLSIGALLALGVRGEQGLARLVLLARRAAPLAAAVLVGSVAAFRSASAFGPAQQFLGFTALAVLAGSAIVGLLGAPAGSIPERLFSSRFLRFFGKHSYAIYVFHSPLDRLLDRAIDPAALRFGPSPAFNQAIFVLAGTGLSVLISLACWYGFEGRLLALKDRLAPIGRKPSSA